jgi:uncharacterized repeat protein (TIGR01451 family)
VVVPPVVPPAVVTVSPVSATPRLRVAKRGPARVRAGGTARFRIRVANVGDATARRIRIVDVVPSGFFLVRAESPGVRLVAGRPTWNVGRIRAGHSRTVYIRIRADRQARGGRCNRVRVRSAGTPTTGARACFHITALPPRAVRVPVTG